MKKQNKMPPKSKSNFSEEPVEKAPVKADSQHGLPADKKVMATHGFLRILSTIGKR